MNKLQRLLYAFGPYTDPREKAIGRFFARIRENDNSKQTHRTLNRLLSQDIAAVNLWTEYRYKGYRYLTKSMRRDMYKNLEIIKADFETTSHDMQIDLEQILAQISDLGVDTTKLRQKSDQLQTFVQIMQYLSPANGRYVYRESSSFGRLLQNPAKQTLEGDCNQIVTLYISLFATKHSINDLELTVYPGHVALHLAGVDIETTNGQFAHYPRTDASKVAVEEIVSINLLDTSDAYLNKNTVPSEIFLEAARLAYILGSDRALVEQNLSAAYNNTVVQLMERQQYSAALKYAKQSKDQYLVQTAGHNGSIHALSAGKFAQARSFAAHSKKRTDLLRSINYNEGVHLYNSKKYQSAITLFQKSGHSDMVLRCYEGLYFEQQNLLKNAKTVDDIKKLATTVRKLHHYATKSQNTKLIQHAKSLMKYL